MIFASLRLLVELRRLRQALERLVTLKEAELMRRAAPRNSFLSLPTPSKHLFKREKEEAGGQLDVSDADLAEYERVEERFRKTYGRGPADDEELRGEDLPE